MCFFAASYLFNSEKPWNITLPDEMQLTRMLQVYSSMGPAGLRDWLDAGVDVKLARGFQKMLSHAAGEAFGNEADDYKVMLSVIDDHIQTLT